MLPTPSQRCDHTSQIHRYRHVGLVALIVCLPIFARAQTQTMPPPEAMPRMDVPSPQDPKSPAPALDVQSNMPPPPRLAVPPSPDGGIDRRAHAGDDDDDTGEPNWIIAERGKHKRYHDLVAGVGIWPTTLSFSGLWAIPVARRGLIHGINDSLDVELGLTVAAFGLNVNWAMVPAAGVRWNFFLTPRWTAFADLKVAGIIPISNNYDPDWFGVFVGAGSNVRLSRAIDLRLEINYPQGLFVALSFPIGRE